MRCGPEMALRRPGLLLVFALSAVLPARVVAQAVCTGVGMPLVCDNDFQEEPDVASACLSQWGASFAEDDNAYAKVKSSGATGHLTCTPGVCDPEDVLPLSYESPDTVSSGYRYGCVEQILRFARESWPLSTDRGGRLLYEASFRKASAHGMFGDDRLVRGLNLALDPDQSTLLNDPIKDGLLHLDSRVCQSASSPSVLTGSETLCQTLRDCGVNEICAPARFGDLQAGLFGAVQEYRRAEQTLVEAIRDLGLARFRAYDLEDPRCGAVGCAARLLIRLGALRARAQAEHLDLVWSRAAAAGGGITQEVTCSQPTGSLSRVCRVDRDCDASPGAGDGVCGSSAKERALVALRQEAAEAVAEAGVSLSLYQQVAPAALATATTDMAMLQSSLAQIADLSTRSLQGSTPFGLPSNYVPFLSDSQKELLGCGASNFSCLEALLEGGAPGAPNTQGVLDELDVAAHQAPLNLDAYADAIRDEQSYAADMRQQYEDMLVRMYGASCESSSSGCTCSTTDEKAGRCVTFQSRVWVVAGVDCSNPSNPFAQCSTVNADGAIEEQLQAVQAAKVALENVALEIERLDLLQEVILEGLASKQLILNDSCTEFEAYIGDLGDELINAYEDIRSQIRDVIKGQHCTTGEREGLAGVDSDGNQCDPDADFDCWEEETGEIVEGERCAEARENAAADDQRLTIDQQIAIRQLEIDKLIELRRIMCEGREREILEIEAQDSRFNLQTQYLNLQSKEREALQHLVRARIAANALASEIRRARQRLDEAQALSDAWTAGAFRNPQNYRALALQNQLAAARYLRRARLVTWMLLRATAYDLARPDFVSPLRGYGESELADISSCLKSECVDAGVPTGESCARDGDCSAGTCQQSSTTSDMAGADGSCSLQAVFAARDAEDLRSLIRRAFAELSSTDRDTACNGSCVKSVSLRNIFSDPLASAQKPLGDVLAARPLSIGNEAELDFGISLQRGFALCPLLDPSTSATEKLCQPGGVAGLLPDESGTPGETASDDFWNARILGLDAQVTYRFERDPRDVLCRNPATGTPVKGLADICSGPGVCIPNGCSDAAGNPIDCECAAILTGDPVFDLVQVGPGIVRTRLAEPSTGPVQPPRDSFLVYRMRRGSLPTSDAEPRFRPFRFSGIPLPSSPPVGTPDASGQGVPLASPQWQLRLKPSGLVNQAIYMPELVASIEDIDLTFTYEAFNLP